MVTQLRDYRIASGSLDPFVEQWRTQIVPIREALGFTIGGAWVTDDGRFVWLLSHPGGWEAFEAADRGYHDSPQRAALDPDPARMIEAQTTARLTEVAR